MRVVALDFETFYDAECSVTVLGTEAYVRHPRFNAYLVSFVWDMDGKRGEWVGEPEKAPWYILKGATAIAHNTMFEIAVVGHLMQKGIVPSDCLPDDWRDTADLAAFFCLARRRSLAEVMQVFRVTMNKAPRAQAKGVTGEQFRANPVLWAEICEYCLDDSRACMKVWEALGESWPEDEQIVADLTKQAAIEGIRIDRAETQRARILLQQKIEEFQGTMPWVAAGDKPMSIPAFRRTCEEAGLDLPASTAKGDEAFQDFVEEHGEDYPWIQTMGTLRSANRLEKVLAALDRRADENDVVNVGLKYFGGHLGRWSGDEVNLQNLNKEPIFGIDLRGIVLARKGKTFVIFDFAQIEPRTLHWLIGDTVLLDFVKSGMSIYEAYARSYMGWLGGELKSEDKRLYALAKATCLGLGYGMGAERFLKASLPKTVVAAAIPEGLSIEDRKSAALAFSKSLVDEYRMRNWKVPEFWKAQEYDFRQHLGQKTYEKALPSGRSIYYYHLTSRQEIDQKYGRMREVLLCSFFLRERASMRMWGGILTENYIQAVARDIVADRMVTVYRETGAFPMFTSHDELVYEVPEDEAQDWYDYLKAALCEPPDWAVGLPLGVEGLITDKYTK